MRKLAGGVRERGGSRGALTAKLRRPALEERRDAFAEILRAGRRHECVALGFELFVERYTRRLIVA
jgi:hypothetical protein